MKACGRLAVGQTESAATTKRESCHGLAESGRGSSSGGAIS
jgi:hypothetical protein